MLIADGPHWACTGAAIGTAFFVVGVSEGHGVSEATTTETVTLSAADAAAVDDNFAQFKTARAKERLGEPLPDVEKPAKAVDGETVPLDPREAKLQQRRERQDAINRQANKAAERVKGDFEGQLKERDEKLTAAETRLKALEAELAQARSASSGRPVGVPSAPPRQVAADPEPSAQDAAKYPGGEYDPKFQRDLAAWAGRDAYRKEQQAERDRQQQEAHATERASLTQTFASKLGDEAQADPVFGQALSTIQPNAFHILNIKPLSHLTPQEPKTALNVLAEEILRSEHSGKLVKHFHAHPELLTEFANYPNPRLVMRAFDRLEATFGTAPAAATSAPPVKTVTEAPPPPTTLGSRVSSPSDPLEAAMKANDPVGYKRARNQERMASQKR